MGLFRDDPMPPLLIQVEDTGVVIAPYNGSDDPAVDRAAADAALAKKLRLLDATWAAKNGGLFEKKITGGGIASVAQGDGSTKHPASTGYTEKAADVVITLAAAWEESADERTVIPVVCYKGKEVPLSHLSYMGDGKTALCLCVIVDNTNERYGPASPVEADWTVVLHGFVRNIAEIDPGSVSLPVTEEKTKLVGIENVSVKRVTNEGEETTAGFTTVANLARLYVAAGAGATAPAEILNDPGEELETLVYGANWTAGSQNEKGYLPGGTNLVMAIVQVNPEVHPSLNSAGMLLHTATAADQGKAFAVVNTYYAGKLTEFPNPTAGEGGATEPSKKKVTIKFQGGVYQKVYRTAA